MKNLKEEKISNILNLINSKFRDNFQDMFVLGSHIVENTGLNGIDSESFEQRMVKKDLKSGGYVYILLTSEDDIIVVGKSQFTFVNKPKWGDLFYAYEVAPINTSRLIINELIKTKVLADDTNNILEKIQEEINNYTQKAIIMICKKSDANQLETDVGNYLLEKGYEILKENSHRY